MQSFSRCTHIALVIAFGVALGAATGVAQDAGKAARDKKPFDPCCGITAIDMATKTVTGKVTATGATFTMKVADAAWLKGLKMGETLEFTPAATSSTSSAASTAGGTTTRGSNVPRDADTRPKDCVATAKDGKKTQVPCPKDVPIRK